MFADFVGKLSDFLDWIQRVKCGEFRTILILISDNSYFTRSIMKDFFNFYIIINIEPSTFIL
jgi:hypothetical protein